MSAQEHDKWGHFYVKQYAGNHYVAWKTIIPGGSDQDGNTDPHTGMDPSVYTEQKFEVKYPMRVSRIDFSHLGRPPYEGNWEAIEYPWGNTYTAIEPEEDACLMVRYQPSGEAPYFAAGIGAGTFAKLLIEEWWIRFWHFGRTFGDGEELDIGTMWVRLDHQTDVTSCPILVRIFFQLLPRVTAGRGVGIHG